MKRVFSTILLLLVLSFSYPIFSQQRNVVINTSSVDRTVITTDPDVDIWTQLEQERIAAERAEQERIATEKAEQARIAAEKAEQERIAAERAEQARIAAEKAEQERITAERAEQAHIAAEKAEQERIAAERAEQARIAAEKAEQEHIAAETMAVETMDTQSIQQMASAEDVQECERVHTRIVNLARNFPVNNVFNKYDNLYKKLPKTEENIQNLKKIQIIVSSYFNTNGSAYPYLGSQLKNASSTEEQMNIFLSYYQE